MADINRANVILELSVAEPILVKEAERLVRELYFDPAVKQLQKDFEDDKVTKEIEGGVDAKNISQTLAGNSYNAHNNLYSFIGFEQDPDEVLQPIRDKLDPEDPGGPQLKYIRGSAKNNLEFQFQILGPNKDEIYKETPVPWGGGGGLSWAERIELGMPGYIHFLNVSRKREAGRSGGGVQIQGELPNRQYINRPYLSAIFRKFLDNFT